MNTESLREEFKAGQSFWHFLGMGVITGGFYFVYWLIRSLEVISKKYPSIEAAQKNKLQKTSTLLWVLAALFFLAIPVNQELMYSSIIDREFISSGIYLMLSYVFLIAYIIVYYMAIFNFRNFFALVLKERKQEYDIQTLWLVVFSVGYLYYALEQAVPAQNSSTSSTKQETTHTS